MQKRNEPKTLKGVDISFDIDEKQIRKPVTNELKNEFMIFMCKSLNKRENINVIINNETAIKSSQCIGEKKELELIENKIIPDFINRSLTNFIENQTGETGFDTSVTLCQTTLDNNILTITW